MPDPGMSLLFALVDTTVLSTSKTVQNNPTLKTELDGLKTELEGLLTSPDRKRAKAVREELYKALYAIVEYPAVTPNLNKAVGVALSRAMREPPAKYEDIIKELGDILRPIVMEAIKDSR